MTNPTLQSIYGAAVNNALLDPISGFDVDVWLVDQATGEYRIIGRFTSIQVTVRNATEPYLEFNQRVPRMLDGEFQIGWVLERGLIDARILQHTFGVSAITRELRLSRSPRFQITFEMNAPELDEHRVREDFGNRINPTAGTIGNGELYLGALSPNGNGAAANTSQLRRKASGQLQLTFCRVDSLVIGATAGRSVVATRWEGLAEGISEVNRTDVWAGTALPRSQAADAALNRTRAAQQDVFGRPPVFN
jgi:hypothetical protein